MDTENTCSTCRYWDPEPRHKIWGRCGRTDHAMQYGARSAYPYDYKPDQGPKPNPFDNKGRISTYRDFGCNRFEAKTEN